MPASAEDSVYRACRRSAWRLLAGTIETGMFADFAVLDADPQVVDPLAIKNIAIVATILCRAVTLTTVTRKPRRSDGARSENQPLRRKMP